MKTLHQAPKDPDFVQNPYPFYERSQAAGSLFVWHEYDLICASSYETVSALLKDRRLGREAPSEDATTPPDHLKAFHAVEQNSMLELEPPRHTRLRAQVLRAFTSRRINVLEPEIAALSNDLITAFPQGDFDLLDAFARPLPVIIICRLLGVPAEHATDLLRWSNAMTAMYQAQPSQQDAEAAEQATKDFTAFLTTYIAQKRKAPCDDLISALIAAEDDGETLSSDELIATCILLLNAGHEATVHTLGNGVVTLIEHGKPPITSATIEEIIRYDPPLHMFTRWVYEDVEIDGTILKRGDKVGCLLAAANRDPAAYENPSQFQPDRRGPINTSFGAGIHFCVGAPLARLELLVGLRTLFEMCPSLALTQTPQYADVYHFHGLERLMVRL